MRRSLLATTWIAVGAFIIQAQERDPQAPNTIAHGIANAELVVSGQFITRWPYPWFDGWHYTGYLRVDEVFWGDPPPNGLARFQWIEPFGATCFICQLLHRFGQQHGIWVLQKRRDRFELANAAMVCGGPFPIDAREEVLVAIQARR